MRSCAVVLFILAIAAAAAQDVGKKPDDAKPGATPTKPGAAPTRPADAKPTDAAPTKPADAARSPLEFTVQDIDGKDVPLSRYKGKVCLIVNVASKCGYTPQYEQLQKVFEKYQAQGLRVLAFPSNDFGQQEPESNDKIKEFCKTNFGVTFDLFAKVPVKGKNAAPLYGFLTSKEKNEKFAGPIKWNFTKFLIDRDGNVVARFESAAKPDAPEVTEAIEKALAAKK